MVDQAQYCAKWRSVMLDQVVGRVQSGWKDRARSLGEQPLPVSEPIAGRVLLASGEEMSCTALMRSPHHGEIRVQGKTSPGEIIVCALDHVGILVGKVTAASPSGCTVTFILKDIRREKVAARLEWHATQSDRTIQLQRAPRIVPIYRAVKVRLGERIILDGTILDISMSGAAISLHEATPPFVGARVRVGERFATVTRLINTGIAIQFIEPFTPQNFDERVRP